MAKNKLSKSKGSYLEEKETFLEELSNTEVKPQMENSLLESRKNLISKIKGNRLNYLFSINDIKTQKECEAHLKLLRILLLHDSMISQVRGLLDPHVLEHQRALDEELEDKLKDY